MVLEGVDEAVDEAEDIADGSSVDAPRAVVFREAKAQPIPLPIAMTAMRRNTMTRTSQNSIGLCLHGLSLMGHFSRNDRWCSAVCVSANVGFASSRAFTNPSWAGSTYCNPSSKWLSWLIAHKVD